MQFLMFYNIYIMFSCLILHVKKYSPQHLVYTVERKKDTKVKWLHVALYIDLDFCLLYSEASDNLVRVDSIY